MILFVAESTYFPYCWTWVFSISMFVSTACTCIRFMIITRLCWVFYQNVVSFSLFLIIEFLCFLDDIYLGNFSRGVRHFVSLRCGHFLQSFNLLSFFNVRSLPLLTMFFAYFGVLNSNNKTVSHHIICFLIIAFLHHKLQIGNKLISSFSFCLKMDMKFISVIYWQKFPTPHIYFYIIYKTLTLIYTSKPLSTSI